MFNHIKVVGSQNRHVTVEGDEEELIVCRHLLEELTVPPFSRFLLYLIQSIEV